MLNLSICSPEERAGTVAGHVLILQLSIWGVKFREGASPPGPLSHRPPAIRERGRKKENIPEARRGWRRPSPGGREGDGRGAGGEAALRRRRRDALDSRMDSVLLDAHTILLSQALPILRAAGGKAAEKAVEETGKQAGAGRRTSTGIFGRSLGARWRSKILSKPAAWSVQSPPPPVQPPEGAAACSPAA
jgi:hypothetical protein